MDNETDILFLSDNPNAPAGVDLDILYPGRVKKQSFVTEDCTPEMLGAFNYVVTMVCDGKNLEQLDYEAIEEYARGGGTVISCLFEYARHRGLNFSKTHVMDRLRPALRIEAETSITRGYAQGDEVWWYGMVSSAPDQTYANQMLQRQILDVAESADIRILATSTINGGAVMIHERIDEGEILALDLLSPLRPFHNSWGSTNKYLFVGNLIGQSVRYGKQYPERLSYDDFVLAMHETAAKYPQLCLQAEGACSDGRQL
ncbi:MAG: hypothetical protein KAI66_23785, partial [Lentisphaeria bacterium]|nr:hypothetical protein [Lentisphaeria bacterium]